jgi:DNA-binding NarL/FixJ family response regulator
VSRADRITIPELPERFPSRCPFSGLPIRTRPQWSYTNPDNTYRASIALIGEHIFWVVPRGYVTAKDMQAATAMALAIKAEAHPGDGAFVFIENFTHAKGGTAGARRCYLDFTNTLDGLLGSFPYGMSPFFRLSFNLSRRLRLHRYKVHMVGRYEAAVQSAMAMLRDAGIDICGGGLPLSPRQARRARQGRREPACRPAPVDPGNDLSAHVDHLLSYLAQFDLEIPGIPEPRDKLGRHSMESVYEALAMLKADMDQFFKEHRELMEALRVRHELLLKKTAAIEARNRELQTLLEKSGADQKQLGEIVLRNVETLLKPLVKVIAQDACSAVQREWLDAIRECIDDLTEDLVPRADLSSYRLTPQESSVARMIRSGARSKDIARQLGLSVRTVETFRARLREKLGLRGQPRNLRTVLLAIPDGGFRRSSAERRQGLA